MDALEGKTAVVTGAGSGIGRGIALALAGHGVHVVVADVNQDTAEAVAEEVRATGRRSLAVAADVSDLAQVEALADRAYAEFGSVEILANNAGVSMRPYRASWDTSYEDYQWVIGVNLWGVIHGHHAFVPRMRETPGPKHIVNTSSMSSMRDAAGLAAYTASKGAVDHYSLAAAEELATQNIGLTLLFPGFVRTDISKSEQLRPADQQSESRHVKPYSDYLGQGGNEGNWSGAPAMAADDPMLVPLDPIDAGSMVVRAIRENRRFCVTHPTPAELMRTRTELMIGGYEPLGQSNAVLNDVRP
ncbi:NAD(P)-dependent dehydrogenase (short-subunit alcohol dehydrogenase family) [Nocardioides sp. J9]|uniref:SDR family NAD(P)-dependent oxidoreductase n=1 Tax=Nocardioides sp. J9 TaxID=935844 RepID=UPI0011A6CCF8|nr:SDR family NAD(P)-dependent oxidoreductase [Nocardioides sp. J9]TWG98557.1 NAD(P)-dependent dehydrogenase (short-subunit alcohol dehydrogenase family) [Nocardioides sp. J9]